MRILEARRLSNSKFDLKLVLQYLFKPLSSERRNVWRAPFEVRLRRRLSLVPRRSLLTRTTWREISWRHRMACIIRWRHDIWHQVESSEQEDNTCMGVRLKEANKIHITKLKVETWTVFHSLRAFCFSVCRRPVNTRRAPLYTESNP